MQVTKTVGKYLFGRGALEELCRIEGMPPAADDVAAVYFIDHVFREGDFVARLPLDKTNRAIFVDTTHEPTTDQVDRLTEQARAKGDRPPSMVVGIGGGSTLDVAKAVSNLLTNGGRAEDYQGWDLVPKPGVFKVGVPTLSGTGAETSRTCVLMNHGRNLKLGMNSDHSVFDYLLLDPDLSVSVPRDQFFHTGVDTYVHCVESLAGRHRHPIADALAREALQLCREVFLSPDMQAPENREKLMVASFLGGIAIANSHVGVVHPFSAGLSMVLGLRHGVANCVAMRALGEFYPREVVEFERMIEAQGVSIPSNVCGNLADSDLKRLFEATIVHEKPLANALGDDFAKTLTRQRAIETFKQM